MTAEQTDFPHQIREIENLWIPMPDGTRLAARVWMPADAAENPVPAILELIPYRKRDGMSRRDERMHPWFAGHGYAAIRVDIRGSGESEGILADEYTAQEQQDGLAIIDWLSRQPWCSGAVGMIGISWGGFNGLQIAAHRPPALKAIVTVGSTDDRYADDVHYMGGVELTANFTWSQTFFADLTRPPDPLLVGGKWKEMWLKRLEKANFFLREWMSHRTRDDYWRHGSVCEDFDRIQCAVFAVGGWADSYTNAVGRLLRGLKAPALGLIGPWGHDYPHTAVPGPAIGFLQECLRWWDHWLKGLDTGIMEEPKLRCWLQENLSTDPMHELRQGEWLGLDTARQGTDLKLWLSPGGLVPTQQPHAAPVQVDTPQTLGWTAGEWCAYGACADQPADQAVEDGLSVIFDSAPLTEALEVAGTPRLRLRLASSTAAGQVIMRLNEVDARGRSTRVTYGVLNLASREGFDRHVPVAPGEMMEIEVTLCDVAYRFQPGRRIRAAVSTTYWPIVWPAEQPFALTLDCANSALLLPRLDRASVSPRPVTFEPPIASVAQVREQLLPGEMSRELKRDFLTGEEIMTVVVDDGLQRLAPHGLEVGRRCVERYGIHPDDPRSAWVEADWTMTLGRGDWQIRTEVRSSIRRTADGLETRNCVTAYEGDTRVFHREE
ncbi:MAG: CocE/NonD family hydrolase [Gemmobacter sp.]|jgi:putative CocE/NonD family hydrolase|nr:CocE/NonD family hydrolase [Gemmobacter sp.]